MEVLELTPDEWSVDILSEYLVRVLRDLVSESREARIERALSAGVNLRVSTEFIKEVEKIVGYVEDDDGIRGLKDGGTSSGGGEISSP